MTNEFGALLDRAGYAASIMQPVQRGRCCCYLCGRPSGGEKMDRHEPWGAANRTKSKELGLWVELHHWGCHEGPGSVHDDGDAARQLRADAQRAAMMQYGWSREEWIRRFGKSELSEEECRKLIIVSAAMKKAADGAPVKVDDAKTRHQSPDGDSFPSRESRGETDCRGPAALAMTGKRDGSGDSTISQREPESGAGTGRRIAEIIREFWPEHPTSTRGCSGFQLIDGPDLPF